MALTARQARFCAEYAVDLNATQAATRAGYSAKSAHVQGHQLLRNPKVAARITELTAARAKATELSAEWVLERLKDTYDRAKRIDQLAAANASLGLIGKHLGMFVDRAEISGKDGAPLRFSLDLGTTLGDDNSAP